MKRDQTLLAVVVLIVAVALIILLALAALSFDGTTMWNFDHHMDYPGIWIMGLGMGVPLLAVLIAILVILRIDSSEYREYRDGRLQRKDLSPSQRKEAIDVLAERYARGEISREEYLQILDDIKNQ